MALPAAAAAALASPAALALTPFQLRVLRATSLIPPGYVSTYGALSRSLGIGAGAAQAIGNALHRNPFAPTVPCHRVIKAGLTIGGFEGSAEGCGGAPLAKKRALLAAEGVHFDARGKLVGGAAKVWLGVAAGGGGEVRAPEEGGGKRRRGGGGEGAPVPAAKKARE